MRKNKLDLSFTPTPESPAIHRGDEWLSGSEFSDGVRHYVSTSSESSDRPPKERRNSKRKKPRDLSRGVFTFLKSRKLWTKLTIIIIITFIGTLFIAGYLVRILKTSDYFKIKEIIFNEEDIGNLSYLNGKNIFTVDLRKESVYMAQGYPSYRRIRLFKVLPNRIFVDFIKRTPVSLVKLYRYFYVDEEGVLFDAPPQLEAPELPFILGLETKIFAPKDGSKYNIKELTVALNIIKEVSLNMALKDYKIKKIDVVDLRNASFSMLVPLQTSAYLKAGPVPRKPEVGPKGQTIAEMEELLIKLDIENIKDNVDILSSLLIQIKNDWSNIKYIDLRFKEPVIKLNEDKS